jgi:hypothetical protein
MRFYKRDTEHSHAGVTREHALVSTRSSSSINAALLAYDDAIFTSVFLCDVGGGDLGPEF